MSASQPSAPRGGRIRTLTTRLVILLMAALLITTGVFDYTRLVEEHARLLRVAQDDERIFAETLALAVSRNVRRGRTTDELKDLLDEILVRPGLIGVALYDPDGRVVTQTVAPGTEPAGSTIPDDMVGAALAKGEATSTLVTSASGQVLRYVQPFRWPGGRTGALEIRQTLAGLEKEFRRAIRENILSRLGFLTVFILSVVALTRWNIGRPIRALIAGAQAVGRGDLGQRIHLSRQDEIGQLAEEFNRMATNLQTAYDALLHQTEERLRLEGEVQQAQKLGAVGMLAAEVAHEIGTPLNVISGRAEVLGRFIGPDRPERRHLDVILKQTERISGIIRALLDYTRPRRPSLRPEDILPIIGRVADLLLDRSRRRGARIELDLPVGLPQVLGDADHLQQLFLNLMKNALDASATGGTVKVTTGPDPNLPMEGRAGIVRGEVKGECLAVHVVDGGKGLSAEQLNHVFEPFFSTKGRGQGTGLGLPIAEEIVRAHQGAIEMLSIPDTGTEVIVRLPLAPTAMATSALPAADAAVEASKHVR